MTRLAILLFGGFLLVSCGGSGTTAEPATTFRPSGVGDAWNFQVESINFGIFGSYSGTLTEALTSDTYSGAPSIRDTRTFNLTLQSGPSLITSYEELSPQGVLLAEVDSGALSAVVSNTFSAPSTLSLTTTASGVTTLADGTTFTINYKVVGKSSVVTAAGIFNCWLVNQNVTHSDGTTDAYTMWIAPETGNYVRLTDTTVNPDGSSYQYTASLTSIITPANTERSLNKSLVLGRNTKL